MVVWVFGRRSGELDVVLTSLHYIRQCFDRDGGILGLTQDNVLRVLGLLGSDCGVEATWAALIEQSFEHVEILLRPEHFGDVLSSQLLLLRAGSHETSLDRSPVLLWLASLNAVRVRRAPLAAKAALVVRVERSTHLSCLVAATVLVHLGA